MSSLLNRGLWASWKPTLVGEKVFGVQWDPTNSSPTLTRTDSAVGMVAAAGVGTGLVTNNFDFAPIFGEITPVTDTLGNVFMRIPKFYIRKDVSANACQIRISKTRYPGYYLPAVFWDFTNGRELDYYLHGKYKANLDSTKLASKVNTYPLVSKNIVEFRDYAKANNAAGLLGYQQLDVHAQDVLSTLFTVEFATLNSQSIMSGFTAGQWTGGAATVAENAVNRFICANATAALFAVGQTISVGTASGSISVFYGRTITAIDVYDASNKAISFDDAAVNVAIGNVIWNSGFKSGFSSGIATSSGSPVSNSTGLWPCSYRGIESPWGDIWQFVDGVNINERQAWVALNAADYASNLFTSPYVQLSYVNGNTDGYSTVLGLDPSNPFARFPTAVGGSSSTYYSDYYYQSTGQRIAFVGGSWGNGSTAGLWGWDLSYASSRASVGIGGRLLKKAL